MRDRTKPVLTEWGMAGVAALHRRVAVLVIVDVLCFSTAVDVAVAHGAIVHPYPFDDHRGAPAAASRVGAVLARRRRETGGGFSLSPASLMGIPAGTALLLPSPNGSRLSVAAGSMGIPVLAGCLRNAASVAAAAASLAGEGAIGVVPAGELWPDGSLRPAIEDQLGAGAIIDRLDRPCSPESRLARDAYRALGREVAALIRLGTSGRELVDAGFPGDVDLAVEEDASTSVPLLTDGAFRARM